MNAILQLDVAANHNWTWDRPLYVTYDGGCCDSKRRIDLWTLVGNVVVAIEIDENQHKAYKPDYEENRYNELVMDFTGRFVFLRINPDSFTVRGQRRDPAFDERLQVAEDMLKSLLDKIKHGQGAQGLVEVVHLFYDH